MDGRWRILTLAAIIIAVMLVGANAARPRRVEAQPDAGQMSLLLRELLDRQMSEHAMAASDTWWNTIDLRFDAAQASARQLAEMPVISAASPAGSVNEELPERFFQLQDDMRAAAREVAQAAAQRDAKAMAAASGRLTERCVACHAEFRPRR